MIDVDERVFIITCFVKNLLLYKVINKENILMKSLIKSDENKRK